MAEEIKTAKERKNPEGLTEIRGKLIRAEEVRPGFTVRIHQKIREITPKGEEKERIQVFEGLVIRVHGKGGSKTMTVRKISEGIGVEKILPLQLPSIAAIELIKKARVRRANLGYLRSFKKRLKEEMVTG